MVILLLQSCPLIKGINNIIPLRGNKSESLSHLCSLKYKDLTFTRIFFSLNFKSPHAVVCVFGIKRHKEAKQRRIYNHISCQSEVACSPSNLKITVKTEITVTIS